MSYNIYIPIKLFNHIVDFLESFEPDDLETEFVQRYGYILFALKQLKDDFVSREAFYSFLNTKRRQDYCDEQMHCDFGEQPF
jgi:hypothetical protein